MNDFQWDFNFQIFCFLRNKRHKIVDLLLNVGARFEHDDIEVARELCVAATENDIDRLRLWKKSQVNMNSTDLDGRTPLHVVSVVYVILYYLELPTSGHTICIWVTLIMIPGTWVHYTGCKFRVVGSPESGIYRRL